MEKLDLSLQDIVYFVVKYFKKRTHVQYHPAAMAKNLKSFIEEYNDIEEIE